MRASIQTQKRAKALRRNLTQPEQTLWALLRRNNLGLHFRRQHAVGTYILDFYCASAKLCVEVDGLIHKEQRDHDVRRDAWLGSEGICVLRFSVDDVENRSAAVLADIKQAGSRHG